MEFFKKGESNYEHLTPILWQFFTLNYSIIRFRKRRLSYYSLPLNPSPRESLKHWLRPCTTGSNKEVIHCKTFKWPYAIVQLRGLQLVPWFYYLSLLFKKNLKQYYFKDFSSIVGCIYIVRKRLYFTNKRTTYIYTRNGGIRYEVFSSNTRLHGWEIALGAKNLPPRHWAYDTAMKNRLTIMGLSSHLSTFRQMYSGSVRSNGSTGLNWDSTTMRPPAGEEESPESALKARAAALLDACCNADSDETGHGRRSISEHLRNGPLNSRRALLITLSRSMSSDFSWVFFYFLRPDGLLTTIGGALATYWWRRAGPVRVTGESAESSRHEQRRWTRSGNFQRETRSGDSYSRLMSQPAEQQQ